MSSLTRQVTHALRQRGATVTATDEPDAPAQAATANRFAATVYVGFEARAETVATVCYYAVPTFESAGGRSLATRLVHTFDRSGARHPARGARHATAGPARDADAGGAVRDRPGAARDRPDPGVAAAVVEALESWADAPFSMTGRRSASGAASRTGCSPLNDAVRAPAHANTSPQLLNDAVRPPTNVRRRGLRPLTLQAPTRMPVETAPVKRTALVDSHVHVHPQGSAHLCVTLTRSFNRGRW